MRNRILTLVVVSVAAVPASAAGPLVLMGGGERPPEAVQRFVDWAGGASAKLLVVTWASSEPVASYEGVRDDLAPLRPASIEMAPLPPLDAAGRARFMALLSAASGVFFGGGDQSRIMNVLKDEELLRAVRRRHAEGIVFGGTSAGTAVMSKIMITGEGDFTTIDAAKVETREGLDLLPGVILDQHFIERRRQNRLFGLVLAHPDQLGLGIDEDAALLVEEGGKAQAVGGPVMLVDARAKPGALVVRLVKAGERFEIR
jgi:cyanophycinase